MKRQNSMVSSSASRRENASEKIQSKTIGCMSGIIHLVFKSHSSRRFLTFGKKQIKNESSFPSKAELPKQATVKDGQSFKEDKPNACHNPSLSREAPRSPTLPADIRRSNLAKTPENFRSPPALVVRLMGLEEGPTVASGEEKPESVAERRERLLNALQKCDEDLKALKKIIEAVRSTDQQRTPSPEVISKNVSYFGDKIRTVTEVTCSEFKGEQQPSPVSVLDDLTRSPVSFRNYSQQHSHSIGRVQLQKKPGEENTCFYERIKTSEQLVHKKVEEEENDDESAIWSKRAMKESVEEVCRDIAWGEKREIGRIGLALHDHICRDLIEEIVRDLGLCCIHALPFEACRRRLSF